MLERELKVIDVDPLVITNLLVQHGATQTFDGYIYDIYFDTFDKLLDSKKYSVRLRFQWSVCILAFKQKKKGGNTKLMVENEFIIADIVFVLFVLLWFGLMPYRHKEKKRISFSHEGVCFDMDMYRSIPPLLEIEALQTDTIFSWVEKLQLENHVQLTVGSRWLMQYYQEKQMISDS